MQLYSSGTLLTVSEVSNPGGDSPNNQPPADAIDADVAFCEPTCTTYTLGSKWLDLNMQDSASGYNSTLELTLSDPTLVDAYDFITANDNSCRDPISWAMYRWLDGHGWLLLHEVVATVPPSERYTSYGLWYLYSPPPLPPPSPSPLQPPPVPPPSPSPSPAPPPSPPPSRPPPLPSPPPVLFCQAPPRPPPPNLPPLPVPPPTQQPTANSASPPPSPPFQPAVVLTILAPGSVSDYSDTTALQADVAALAGVDESSVSISVTAASVIITAFIAIPSTTTADAVQESLNSSLSTKSAASLALGISVEAMPTVVIAAVSPSPPSPSPLSPAPTPALTPATEVGSDDVSSSGSGAAAGGAAAAAATVVFVLLGGCLWRRRLVARQQREGSMAAEGDMTTSSTVTFEGDMAGPKTDKTAQWQTQV